MSIEDHVHGVRHIEAGTEGIRTSRLALHKFAVVFDTENQPPLRDTGKKTSGMFRETWLAWQARPKLERQSK
jgi:hypothetical protein